MAVASLVLGILSLICLFFPFATVGLALIATILGILGRKNAQANNQPTGVATAGMAIGIVGLSLGILLSVACALCFSVGNRAAKEMTNDPEWQKNFKKATDEMGKEMQKAQDEAKKAQDEVNKEAPAPPTPPAPEGKTP